MHVGLAKRITVLACRLTELPGAITGLEGLAKLDCSQNSKLTALPAGLGEFQPGLREVIANKCKISEFPASLKKAGGLRTLSLSGNAISSLPDDALQGIIHHNSIHSAVLTLYRAHMCSKKVSCNLWHWRFSTEALHRTE
jgi:Leucine-rich repeat (LRR) protein